MAADLVGEGVRRIDQQIDVGLGEVGREPRRAAEAADPHVARQRRPARSVRPARAVVTWSRAPNRSRAARASAAASVVPPRISRRQGRARSPSRRQVLLDPGRGRDACQGADPQARAADAIQRQTDRPERDQPQEPELCRRRADGFHDAVDPRGALGRDRQQHARSADDVDHRDHGRGGDQGARDRAARITDLISHERRRLRSGPAERQARPEDDVGQVKGRCERMPVDRRRRPEAPAARQGQRHQQQQPQPARHGPGAVEPLGNGQSTYIQNRADHEDDGREGDEIGRRRIDTGAAGGEQRAAGGEIEHARQERECAGPVGPAGHEARERPEGAPAPRVQSAGVGIA